MYLKKVFLQHFFICSSCDSNERLFLRDLVQCTAGTSGGRLSRWLQPEPYVDPSRSELLYAKDEMKCGWPAVLTVLTKDQYGDVVHVPNLRVSVLFAGSEIFIRLQKINGFSN